MTPLDSSILLWEERNGYEMNTVFNTMSAQGNRSTLVARIKKDLDISDEELQGWFAWRTEGEPDDAEVEKNIKRERQLKENPEPPD